MHKLFGNWEMDLVALGAIIGSFMDWLPHVAALLGVVYYSMLIVTWVVNKGWKPEKKQ